MVADCAHGTVFKLGRNKTKASAIISLPALVYHPAVIDDGRMTEEEPKTSGDGQNRFIQSLTLITPPHPRHKASDRCLASLVSLGELLSEADSGGWIALPA